MLHQLCFSIHSSAESGLNEYCQGQHRKQRLPLLSLSSRHFGAREIAYRTLVDKSHGSRIGPGWNRSSGLWISVPSASAHLSWWLWAVLQKVRAPECDLKATAEAGKPRGCGHPRGGLEADRPRFKFQPCHLAAGGHWASCWTSQSLQFLSL